MKLYETEIKAKAKEAGVSALFIYYLQFFGFEIPQKLLITSTVFSVENDLLTPTFKVKRNEAKQYFLSQIKDMYQGAKLQGEH